MPKTKPFYSDEIPAPRGLVITRYICMMLNMSGTVVLNIPPLNRDRCNTKGQSKWGAQPSVCRCLGFLNAGRGYEFLTTVGIPLGDSFPAEVIKI